MSTKSQPMVIPSPIVAYVLRHLQIKTNPCTFEHTNHRYRLARRKVNDYNLIYVTRGRVVWVLDEQPWSVVPGTLLLVKPGIWHQGYATTRQVTLCSIHVEVTLPGGQDVFELLNVPTCQTFDPSSAMNQYLRGAQAEYDRPRSAQEAYLTIPAWARLIVLELLTASEAKGLLSCQSIDPLVTDVLDELNRKIDEPTSLKTLAKWAGYSPQHLNRTFRKHLGSTPLQYLSRMRMERASHLLVQNTLTIAAVAQQVGIADPYYFSRLFRHHHGISPSQYRITAMESSSSNSPA